MNKPFAVKNREEGRGKATSVKFATLEEASRYIQDRWQGAEYVNGMDSFHTDYCSYELEGFSLSDIGKFYVSDGCREYKFNHKSTGV